MEKLISEYLPLAGTVVTLLAFLVSLITETIKNLGFLKKIPTNLVVLVLSVLLCIIAYVIAASVLNYRTYRTHRRFHPGRFHRQLCRDLWLGKIQQPLSASEKKKVNKD